MSFSTKAPCVTFTIPLQNATGRMPYTLTNDYMFRAMLQRSKGALKGIVCSITGFNPKLGYLCRSFDSLNRGQDYMETKPVIQVCFLNFTLFPEAPEFFSTYMVTVHSSATGRKSACLHAAFPAWADEGGADL